ncbi:MAG: NUDIX domain-containing protein, partial [Ilumatobacteraceae bacterium]
MSPVDQVRSVEPVGLRALVRAQLLARRPVDERERTSLERAVEALDRLSAPFSETADPTHVTGSAIVVGRRGVVLHRHRRLGIWLQPGGHVDPGETPWAAARREAAEETGLTVTFAPPVAGGDGTPLLVHVDVH